MLETVREFALERLAASGEGELMRERHASWCGELGEEAWRRLWQQPLRLADLDMVEAEHHNLRSALAWLVAVDRGERALWLATSLTPFWYLRGHRQEGMAWLERARTLVAAESIPPGLAARATYCRGLLVEDVAEAGAAHAEALRLWRAAGDRWGTGVALQSLVVLASVRGRHDEAIALGEEALAIFDALGMWERVSDLRCYLGRAAYARGELERADALLTASLALAREVDDPFAVPQALNALALVSLDRGDVESAIAFFREGVAKWLPMGSKDGIASALAGVATLATSQRHYTAAARLFGAVSAMEAVVGYDVRVERERHQRAEREAAMQGGPAFVAAFAAGRTMRPEDAVAEAAAFLALAAAEPSSTQAAAPAPFGLTRRELEVLRLIAAGRSDREIADALFISRHTAMKHVTNMLGKMGVGSRTAAAALAHKHDLA